MNNINVTGDIYACIFTLSSFTYPILYPPLSTNFPSHNSFIYVFLILLLQVFLLLELCLYSLFPFPTPCCTHLLCLFYLLVPSFIPFTLLAHPPLTYAFITLTSLLYPLPWHYPILPPIVTE